MASPPAPPASDRLEQLARDTGRAAPYTNDLVDGLPEPVRRYFGHAISPGTPLAAGAHISMRGRIKLQRWLPFRARQVLVPCHGTVWAARIAGVISGSDRYVGGTGGLDWRLFGRIPLVHAEGDDVTRSAAERAAGESIWVPTALLPGSGADWSALDETASQSPSPSTGTPSDSTITSTTTDGSEHRPSSGGVTPTTRGAGPRIPSASRSPSIAPSPGSRSPRPDEPGGTSGPIDGNRVCSSGTRSPPTGSSRPTVIRPPGLNREPVRGRWCLGGGTNGPMRATPDHPHSPA